MGRLSFPGFSSAHLRHIDRLLVTDPIMQEGEEGDGGALYQLGTFIGGVPCLITIPSRSLEIQRVVLLPGICPPVMASCEWWLLLGKGS